MHTDIRAFSGMRTQEPTVRAGDRDRLYVHTFALIKSELEEKR
jgi:hypothetical protein